MAKTPKLSDKTLSPLDALSRRAEPAAVESVAKLPETDASGGKPDLTQISAYIPTELYTSVRVSLVGKKNPDGKKLTLTDLVIRLLTDWQREQE